MFLGEQRSPVQQRGAKQSNRIVAQYPAQVDHEKQQGKKVGQKDFHLSDVGDCVDEYRVQCEQ